MTDPLPPAAELNTWKEIADFLGVSVREAQNREKSDGMPVHRLAGKKARVWAYRAELDSWRLRVASAEGVRSSVSVAEIEPPLPADDHKTIGVLAAPNRRLSRRMLLGGLAGIAGASVGAALLLRRNSAAPVRAGVVGNALCAWDAGGSEIWRHPFPEVLRNRRANNGMLRNSARQVQIADLYGDGSRQILFAAGFQQDPGLPGRDELYCFSSEGKILWRQLPDLAVTMGDTKFSGPWFLSDMLIAPGGKRKSIWLSLEHWNWRPGAVLAVDPDGHATVRFVNAGHLYALGWASDGRKNYVMAGGVNNEYACAALAILEEGAPPSCSPQTRGTRFECVDGPKGQPERYVLLPPSEITVASGNPYNVVTLIEKGNQEFTVATRELLNGDGGGMIYRFSASIEPLDVAFDDSWAASHRYLHGKGRINHAISDCPQLKHPVLVRRWERTSGWTTLPVPPSSSRRPDAYQA